MGAPQAAAPLLERRDLPPLAGRRHERPGPRRPAEPGRHARPGGLPLGPVRVTATRVILLVAVVGSIGYLAYAITVRDATQIPMLASGAAVLGIVFAALASPARSRRCARPATTARAGRGRGIFGGVAGIIACGCFAAAAVLALLWGAA